MMKEIRLELNLSVPTNSLLNETALLNLIRDVITKHAYLWVDSIKIIAK